MRKLNWFDSKSNFNKPSNQMRCPYCSREYKRKVFYDRHIIACKILSKTPKELKLEAQEQDDTPSIRGIYDIVLELGIRLSKIEKQQEKIDKWVETKKRKLCIISWLNDNFKPDTSYEEWIDCVKINREHLESIFRYNYIVGITYILQEYLPLGNETILPLKAFDQKEGSLFIYTNNQWKFMSPDTLDNLLRNLSKKIVDEFVKWQEENKHRLKEESFSIEFTENVQKAMGGSYSIEKQHSKIKFSIERRLSICLE